MARRCDICGKNVQTGYNDPKSHKRTLRVFRPNLHSIKGYYNGILGNYKICSKCLKRSKVIKVV